MGGFGGRAGAFRSAFLEGERHHHAAIGRGTSIADSSVASPALIVLSPAVRAAPILADSVSIVAAALHLTTRVLAAFG